MPKKVNDPRLQLADKLADKLMPAIEAAVTDRKLLPLPNIEVKDEADQVKINLEYADFVDTLRVNLATVLAGRMLAATLVHQQQVVGNREATLSVMSQHLIANIILVARDGGAN